MQLPKRIPRVRVPASAGMSSACPRLAQEATPAPPSRSQARPPAFFALAQSAVQRGPQAALYRRDAIAGATNL